mmetsp:Transcript_10896/g.30476  ORF Transcript_10896/g.30476 Transcript_10896/m.30476 type:complete len:263 (-) Transcript_10896:1491-2279(-)
MASTSVRNCCRSSVSSGSLSSSLKESVLSRLNTLTATLFPCNTPRYTIPKEPSPKIWFLKTWRSSALMSRSVAARFSSLSSTRLMLLENFWNPLGASYEDSVRAPNGLWTGLGSRIVFFTTVASGSGSRDGPTISVDRSRPPRCIEALSNGRMPSSTEGSLPIPSHTSIESISSNISSSSLSSIKSCKTDPPSCISTTTPFSTITDRSLKISAFSKSPPCPARSNEVAPLASRATTSAPAATSAFTGSYCITHMASCSGVLS